MSWKRLGEMSLKVTQIDEVSKFDWGCLVIWGRPYAALKNNPTIRSSRRLDIPLHEPDNNIL